MNFVIAITKEGKFALNDEVIIGTNAYFAELDVSHYIKLRN